MTKRSLLFIMISVFMIALFQPVPKASAGFSKSTIGGWDWDKNADTSASISSFRLVAASSSISAFSHLAAATATSASSGMLLAKREKTPKYVIVPYKIDAKAILEKLGNAVGNVVVGFKAEDPTFIWLCYNNGQNTGGSALASAHWPGYSQEGYVLVDTTGVGHNGHSTEYYTFYYNDYAGDLNGYINDLTNYGCGNGNGWYRPDDLVEIVGFDFTIELCQEDENNPGYCVSGDPIDEVNGHCEGYGPSLDCWEY